MLPSLLPYCNQDQQTGVLEYLPLQDLVSKRVLVCTCFASAVLKVSSASLRVMRTCTPWQPGSMQYSAHSVTADYILVLAGGALVLLLDLRHSGFDSCCVVLAAAVSWRIAGHVLAHLHRRSRTGQRPTCPLNPHHFITSYPIPVHSLFLCTIVT